jgi:protein HIRA/HIR1
MVALIVLRSWDGLTLYAVSSDGTLAVFCFDPDELEGIAPHSIQQQYLQKFGFTLPPLPESWSHTSLQTPSSGQRMTPPPSPNRSSHPPHGLNGFGAPSANTGHEVVNTLIAKRNTRRRAHQQSLGPRGVSNSPAAYANSSSYHDSLSQTHSRTHHVAPAISSSLVPEASEHSTSIHLPDRHSSDYIPPDMVTDVLIDSLGATNSAGAKRKSSALDMPEDRPTKSRTLGGDRVRDSNPNIVKEICSPFSQTTVVPTSESETKNVFSAPPVLTYLSFKVTDAGDDLLECKNTESGGRAVFICFFVFYRLISRD